MKLITNLKLILADEKFTLLAPAFIFLLVFFIPISSSLKSILLLLSVFTLLITPFYRQYIPLAFNTLWARAAVVLFVYVIISCIWSEAPLSVQYNTIYKYSKMIFLPLLAVGFIRPQIRLWAFHSYILVMLFTCILSILKDHHLFLLNDPTDPGEIFYNHIVTGVMVAFGVYLAVLMACQANATRWLRFFYLSLVLLGSYQIFFINTGRTGYITYGILSSLLLLQKLSFKKAIMGILVFVGVFFLAYACSPVLQKGTEALISDIKLLQHNQANTSLGYRIQFHRYARSLFDEHPIIGIGTGGFPYRFTQDRPVPLWEKLNEPHSQYWLVLAEQGLIGMLLFLFFLGTLFVTAFKLKETKPFLLGLLTVFCILSVSDTIFCYSTIGYLLIIFSALCFGELIEKQSISCM
ncbi:MAG: O-antigen ligase family protein [Legionella sp.]